MTYQVQQQGNEQDLQDPLSKWRGHWGCFGAHDEELLRKADCEEAEEAKGDVDTSSQRGLV